MTDTERRRAVQAAAWRALAAWPLQATGLTLISAVENLVFRVDSRAGERFVLRLHRPGYHSLPSLESEQLWTAALNAAGIAAPRRRPAADGRRYVDVPVEGGERRYAGLSEWLQGTPMRGLIDADGGATTITGHFFTLGRLAARIHAQAAGWRPPPGFVRPCLDAEGLMGEAPFWGPFWKAAAIPATARGAVRALRARLRERLAALPRNAEVFGLIHADLHPGNVLVDGADLAVIDFDDSAFGWHVYELAVALTAYRHHAQFTDLRAALVRGYRSERALPDDWLAQLPLFFTVRALAQIGWFSARPELGLCERIPALVDEALVLAEQL